MDLIHEKNQKLKISCCCSFNIDSYRTLLHADLVFFVGTVAADQNIKKHAIQLIQSD